VGKFGSSRLAKNLKPFVTILCVRESADTIFSCCADHELAASAGNYCEQRDAEVGDYGASLGQQDSRSDRVVVIPEPPRTAKCQASECDSSADPEHCIEVKPEPAANQVWYGA
jgi:hypothetical protein